MLTEDIRILGSKTFVTDGSTGNINIVLNFGPCCPLKFNGRLSSPGGECMHSVLSQLRNSELRNSQYIGGDN